MKLKSKGSFWKGNYQRLYLRKYGNRPYVEIQASISTGGIGFSWQISEGYALIFIQLICIDIMFCFSTPRVAYYRWLLRKVKNKITNSINH